MFEVRFRYDMVSDNFISSVVQFHKKSKKKKCEFILKGVANDFPPISKVLSQRGFSRTLITRFKIQPIWMLTNILVRRLRNFSMPFENRTTHPTWTKKRQLAIGSWHSFFNLFFFPRQFAVVFWYENKEWPGVTLFR